MVCTVRAFFTLGPRPGPIATDDDNPPDNDWADNLADLGRAIKPFLPNSPTSGR